MPFVILAAAGKLYDKILECIPFMLMVRRNDKLELRLDINAITQAVIIALVTAYIVGWSVKEDMTKMQNQISVLQTNAEEDRKMFRKFFADIYHPE